MEANEVSAIGGSLVAIFVYAFLAVIQPAMANVYMAFVALFIVLFLASIGATALYYRSR
ncbi:MAG: hypothetical protein SFZ02_17885 [bacterium]|nr:hypothetical protein [bacterium]